jgi:hypothetical protein
MMSASCHGWFASRKEPSSHWNLYPFTQSFTGAYSRGWTFDLPFQGFLITHTHTHTHTHRYTVGLLWTSDQPVAETSTYAGQHETNIHAPSEIRIRDPSNQVAADQRLRPRGHWDRKFVPFTRCKFISVIKSRKSCGMDKLRAQGMWNTYYILHVGDHGHFLLCPTHSIIIIIIVVIVVV